MRRDGDPYQPSNGSEGVWFTSEFCDRCANCHPDPLKEPQCNILASAMAFNPQDPQYPREWIYRSGEPLCTAHTPWDWGRDDDGDWIEPDPPPVPRDPRQLDLFPLFDNYTAKDREISYI